MYTGQYPPHSSYQAYAQQDYRRPSPYPQGLSGVIGPNVSTGVRLRVPPTTPAFAPPPGRYIPQNDTPSLPYLPLQHDDSTHTLTPAAISHPPPSTYSRSTSATGTPTSTGPVRPSYSLHGPKYTRPAYRPPTVPDAPVPEKVIPHAVKDGPARWEFKLPSQLPEPSPLSVEGTKTRKLPPLPPLTGTLFENVFTHTSWACMVSPGSVGRSGRAATRFVREDMSRGSPVKRELTLLLICSRLPAGSEGAE